MYDNLNGRIKIKAVAMTTKILRYFYKGVTFYQSFKISPKTTDDV